MFDDSRKSHLPLDLIYLFPAHLTFNFSFHVLNDSRQNAITSDTNDSCKLSEEGSRGYFDDESGNEDKNLLHNAAGWSSECFSQESED